MQYREFYRSKLPHIQPLGGTFFVTARLAGSLPQSEKLRLVDAYNRQRRRLLTRPEHTKEDLDRLERMFFAKYEAILDKADSGPCWLAIPAVAQAVAKTIHFWDTKKYDLIAYTLLSNHGHFVFTLNENLADSTLIALDRVMHSLKSYTATQCNTLLHRKGNFWEHESYDRLVRNRQELFRIVQYILNNPVKARLCAHWRDWKWTYIKPEYNEFD